MENGYLKAHAHGGHVTLEHRHRDVLRALDRSHTRLGNRETLRRSRIESPSACTGR